MPSVVRAIEKPRVKVGDENHLPRWRWTPRMIYLADTLSDGKVSVPYAIVASDDTTVGPPGKERYVLADDEIMLVEWPGQFSTQPGGTIKLEYYAPDEKNHLAKKDVSLKVRAVVPLEGATDDPDLTPEFPGITDKANMDDWQNPPFPRQDAKSNA